MGNQDVTTHKFVAILNKKIEPGKAMNALSHMSVGLVACATPEEIREMGFSDYVDKDGGTHPSVSKNSYVILRADNSNQIRTARKLAIEKGIRMTDFTSSMQEGTYVEQHERTNNTPEAELEYYGLCLFGEIAAVNEIARKFQLWK
jgi:hypothetical protein